VQWLTRQQALDRAIDYCMRVGKRTSNDRLVRVLIEKAPNGSRRWFPSVRLGKGRGLFGIADVDFDRYLERALRITGAQSKAKILKRSNMEPVTPIEFVIWPPLEGESEWCTTDQEVTTDHPTSDPDTTES